MSNKPKKIITKKENSKMLNQLMLRVSLVTAIVNLLAAISGSKTALLNAAIYLIFYFDSKYTIDNFDVWYDSLNRNNFMESSEEELQTGMTVVKQSILLDIATSIAFLLRGITSLRYEELLLGFPSLMLGAMFGTDIFMKNKILEKMKNSYNFKTKAKIK